MKRMCALFILALAVGGVIPQAEALAQKTFRADIDIDNRSNQHIKVYINPGYHYVYLQPGQRRTITVYTSSGINTWAQRYNPSTQSVVGMPVQNYYPINRSGRFTLWYTFRR